jgi:MFS family permease
LRQSYKLSVVFIPLYLIFIAQLGGSLFLPDLVRMLGQSHNILSHNASLETRNWLLGIAMAAPGIIGICAPTLMGALSDNWGRKKLILWSLCFALVGMLLPLIGIASSMFSLVVIGNIVLGFNACKSLGKSCVIDIASGNRRKLYLAWSTISITLGGTIGPLLGSYLSNSGNGSLFSIATPYYFYMCILALTVLIVAFVYKGQKQKPSTSKATINIFHQWLKIRKLYGYRYFLLLCSN